MARWRLITAGVAVLAVLAVAYVMATIFAPAPDELDLAREKSGAKGLYTLSIAPEDGEVEQGELHSWVLTIRDREGEAVENAEITIDGGMPEHGHGLPTAPRVSDYLGEGRYRIEGVRFNMGGRWVLEITVNAAAGADSADFNLLL